MAREPSPREKEIKRDFAPPRWIWNVLVTIIVLLAVGEFVAIFFILSQDAVLRLQTFNGTMVMTGGLLAFSITTLIIMFPLKFMTVYMLTLYEDLTKTLKDSAKDQKKAGEEMLAEMKDVAKTIKENVGGIPKRKRGDKEIDIKKVEIKSNNPKDIGRLKGSIGVGGNALEDSEDTP